MASPRGEIATAGPLLGRAPPGSAIAAVSAPRWTGPPKLPPRVGRADRGDLAGQVTGRVLPRGPVADHADQTVRPRGHLRAGAHQRRNLGLGQDPARRREGLPAVGRPGEFECRVRGTRTPGDIDVAARRVLALAGRHPGVIAVDALDQGCRRREGASAVVGPPHVHRAVGVGVRRAEAGAVTGTGGADIAAAVPAESNRHVVARRAGHRLRRPGARLPGRAAVG